MKKIKSIIYNLKQTKLNQINGSLYFTAIIIVITLQNFGFYIVALSNASDDIIIGIIVACAILSIILTLYRAKRFIEWKQYFFSYLFCSLISQFPLYMFLHFPINPFFGDLSILGCVIIVLLLKSKKLD